jgi:hypothetical protein
MTMPPRKQVIPPQGPLKVTADQADELRKIKSFNVVDVPVNPTPSTTTDSSGEQLVDKSLLAWSYTQAGILSMFGCFGAFFLVYYLEGIMPVELLGMARDVYNETMAQPYNGTRFYTAMEMQNFYQEAQSAYFLSIVVFQVFTLYVCKVADEIPYGSKMFANMYTYYSFFPSALFAVFIVYSPFFKTILGVYPVRAEAFIPAVVAGFILLTGELIFRFARLSSSQSAFTEAPAVATAQDEQSIDKTSAKDFLTVSAPMKRNLTQRLTGAPLPNPPDVSLNVSKSLVPRSLSLPRSLSNCRAMPRTRDVRFGGQAEVTSVFNTHTSVSNTVVSTSYLG